MVRVLKVNARTFLGCRRKDVWQRWRLVCSSLTCWGDAPVPGWEQRRRCRNEQQKRVTPCSKDDGVF